MRALKPRKGITLLEMLLVLAIISAIAVLTLKMYKNFTLQANIQKAQYDIDTLFQAMTEYYRANCATGTLSTNSQAPYFVTVSNLVSNGYLPANWEAKNPITSGGYVLQFNVVPAPSPVNVNACVVLAPGTACVPSGPDPLQATQATALIWAEQVAAVATNMTQGQAVAYQQILGADCLSGLPGQQTGYSALIESLLSQAGLVGVAPCSPGSMGNFFVWQRLPSATGRKTHSMLWPMMPILQQFNLQYTHDQMFELNQGYSGPQFYTCGG